MQRVRKTDVNEGNRQIFSCSRTHALPSNALNSDNKENTDDCRWPTMWNRPESFSPPYEIAGEHKRVN